METLRDEAIPVLKCRGTHYQVGFQIGKRFKSMINQLLSNWKYFQGILKVGQTASGKVIVENSLLLCKSKFPCYIDEIEGMAKGAEIPFKHLFMLNIDSTLSTLEIESSDDNGSNAEFKKAGGTGCTSILCNKDEVILGHTEDAMAEIKDHVYIIAAEILNQDNENKVLEKFTTLCYAGTLMGYTMGFNNHGMVYSVNTIFPDVCVEGTPRAFIARALLGAKNLPQILEILKDKGNGIADGFSLNLYFYPNGDIKPDPNQSREVEDKNGTSTILYNIEISPLPKDDLRKESILDVHEVTSGSVYTHCNRYLRLGTHEYNPIAVKYSDKRNSAICRHCEPCCGKHIKDMLSDESDFNYPLYNSGNMQGKKFEMDFIRTVAVGIFDISEMTWSVFSGPPASSDPVHIFKIN